MPKLSSAGQVTIVDPKPYGRLSLAQYAAVVVHDGETKRYVTVNNPVQAFFPLGGGVTVQAPYGSGETFKSRHYTTVLVALIDDQGCRVEADWSGIFVGYKPTV